MGTNKRNKSEDNYTHNIDRNNERSLDRRGFMKTMVGAAGVFAAASLPWSAVAAKKLMAADEAQFPKQKIAAVHELEIGGALNFTYPGEHDKALLVRLGENEYKAYNNACTHLLCPVFWSNDEGKLICPCHKGYFDVQTGNPIAGPPQRPLPKITVQVENGIIYATGVKPYEN